MRLQELSLIAVMIFTALPLASVSPARAQDTMAMPSGPLDSAVRPAPKWQREGYSYVRNSRWVNDDGYVIRGEVVYSDKGNTYVRRAPQYSYSRLPGVVKPARNFNISSR